ncbi:MAG TPA: hypothetical protein VD833_24815 [Vicinamibacterales bacterium]|nr:hypothetical protein [Vicinamibacterales bacterium]
MSILDRLQPTRHLDDDALMEIWAAARLDVAPLPHPHLADCGSCRSRYAALTTWADSLRQDAYAEADEVFTPERLAAQQSQILRRLEAMGRPARVIAFPRFTRVVRGTRSSTQRWIGAAAAAGLFVGLAAGQLMDLPWQTGSTSQQAEAPIARNSQSARSSAPMTPVPVSLEDEELFYDLDSGPVRALEAIDAITPRSRDLDLRR